MPIHPLMQTCAGAQAITPLRLRIAALLPLLFAPVCHAWGPDGHAIVNRLAAENLPASVPAFLRTPAAIAAIVYYSSEPDRWRSSAEPELNAAQAPEHFIFLEWADLAGPIPRRRYDFIRALAAAQSAHPDIAMTPEAIGLQPYVTTEIYQRLQSAMRDYRALAATHHDTKPSEAEIVFLAGWLGHYVGDGANPMHTSINYAGWVGPNPNHYTTDHAVHWFFENTYVDAAKISPADVAPLVAAKPTVLGDVFADYLIYLRHSNSLVEKTYQLEKAGAFAGSGTPTARDFVDQRLAAGATELRNLIYTAWIKSADPLPPDHGN